MKTIAFCVDGPVNVPGVFVGTVRFGLQHSMPDADAAALVARNIAVYGSTVQSHALGPNRQVRPGLYGVGANVRRNDGNQSA